MTSSTQPVEVIFGDNLFTPPFVVLLAPNQIEVRSNRRRRYTPVIRREKAE